MLASVYTDRHLLVALVVIALTWGCVSCLKCHVCSSFIPGQEDCLDVTTTDTKYLQNCVGPTNASCRTQEQWIDFEVLKQSHDKRVIRQCASTTFEDTRLCYYRAGFGGKTNVCNCIGDGCNSTSRTTSALLLTLGALFFLKIFRFNSLS